MLYFKLFTGIDINTVRTAEEQELIAACEKVVNSRDKKLEAVTIDGTCVKKLEAVTIDGTCVKKLEAVEYNLHLYALFI